MKDLKKLIPYIKKYKSGMMLGLVFILGTNFFHTLAPKIMGDAIDELNFMQHIIPRDRLFYYAQLLILVTVVQGIFRFAMRYTMIGISRKIEFDYKNDFFKHYSSSKIIF